MTWRTATPPLVLAAELFCPVSDVVVAVATDRAAARMMPPSSPSDVCNSAEIELTSATDDDGSYEVMIPLTQVAAGTDRE